MFCTRRRMDWLICLNTRASVPSSMMAHRCLLDRVFLFLVSACLLTIASARLQAPVVNSSNGKLRGTILGSMESPVAVKAFLGVPYAQPPVGNLRMALPEPVSPWTGTKDASKYGPACPQREQNRAFYFYPLAVPETGVSEDCLHLDVYTPDVSASEAVMVYFHGGGFTYGKNSLTINGTALVAHEGIVVVSVNYRLGALGFLQDESKAWPSNLGFRDQQLALRWVRDNIASFGGDPARVTINGEGSGAISVSAHILSQSSRGLFHRAIAQSGTALQLTKNASTTPYVTSDVFVENLGCSQFIDKLACLREKSVEDILDAQGQDYIGAVLDGDFLPDDPEQKYADGDFARVGYLSGVTRNEGFLTTMMALPESLHVVVQSGECEKLLKAFIERYFKHGTDEIQEALLKFYMPGDMESDPLRQRMAQMVGYFLLELPSYQTALLHAAKVPQTYFYEFAQQPSSAAEIRTEWHDGGCDHGFDTVFTYGYPLLESRLLSGRTYSPAEQAFSKDVMKYWGNFVKTGNPNDEELVVWPLFSTHEEDYMILQEEFEPSKHYKRDDLELWTMKVESILKRTTAGAGNKHSEL